MRASAPTSGANGTAIMPGEAHWPTQPAKEAHWAMVPQPGMAWSQPQGIEVLAVIMGELVHALADAMPASGAKAEITVRRRARNVRRRCINNRRMGTRMKSAFGKPGSS